MILGETSQFRGQFEVIWVPCATPVIKRGDFQDLRMIFERSSNQGCFNPSRTRRNLVIYRDSIYYKLYIYIYYILYIYICGCRWCMAVHLTIFPTVYLFSIFLQRLNFRPGRVSGHSAQTDTGERSRP